MSIRNTLLINGELKFIFLCFCETFDSMVVGV